MSGRANWDAAWEEIRRAVRESPEWRDAQEVPSQDRIRQVATSVCEEIRGEGGYATADMLSQSMINTLRRRNARFSPSEVRTVCLWAHEVVFGEAGEQSSNPEQTV